MPEVGGLFNSFGPPVTSKTGYVVAWADTNNGDQGIFRFFAGEQLKLAATDDETAPLSARFFAGFADVVNMNDLDHVVARVTTDDGDGNEVKQALYRFFAGSPTSDPNLLAQHGDDVPLDTSRFFAGFGMPAISDGEVVVATVITDLDPPSDPKQALYRFFAGYPVDQALKVAVQDDAAPVIDRFFAGFGEHPDINLHHPSLNGNVAFQATLEDDVGDPAGEGLFLFFSGSAAAPPDNIVLLAKETQGTPAGGTYGGGLPVFGDPAINKYNQVVAQAYINNGGSPTEGLFLFFAGSAAEPEDPVEVTEIVLEGEAANGCTYGGTPPVFPYVAYNNNAQVVYVANLDCSGEPSQGVFIASLDNDGDGVLDFLDNCPAVFNADQKNLDKALAPTHPGVVADELGNACDDDKDGDGADDDDDDCPIDPDCDNDGRLDGVDGCPTTVTIWTTPIGDDDCDGFTDADEGDIGTDPADRCANTPDPNDEADDKWPPDWDDSQTVNLLDLLPFKPHFNTTYPDPWYDARYDLYIDGAINLLDLLPFKPFFNLSCTP